jgi:D-threo-aldose 1-dehydrogenase
MQVAETAGLARRFFVHEFVDSMAPVYSGPVVAILYSLDLAVKKTVIPATDLTVARFILGTASLFNVGTRKRRAALLSAAIDAGFTHFDTAPYYGFGMAERDLAPLLRAHPQLTLTTKFGLHSPGGEAQSAPQILFRKALGRVLPVLSQPLVDFRIARARLALEQSLVRLGRDCIDLYLLHEPLITLVDTDELQQWLQDCVAAGKIRYYGLAATADRLAPFLQQGSPLALVVQMPDSLDGREADLLDRYGHPRQISYGYVSAARQRGTVLTVSEILQQALQRNPDSAIIVSTTRLDHLREFALTESSVA